jgi:hypothetical protein
MRSKLLYSIRLCMLIILGAMGTRADAQIVFEEDFDGVPGGGFPAGWSLFNVDGRTPNAQVAYVNAAWIRREDFANNVTDSAAFSTSWYTPTGASDDWMFTPAIGPLPANCILKWNAIAYDADFKDGYQVRIMNAAPTTGNITSSTVIFSTTGENSTWTARSVDLSSRAGETVYIAFRNNSNDKFLLLIDDIVVQQLATNDLMVSSVDTSTTYTSIPRTQTHPIRLKGVIKNNGTGDATNVTLRVDVLNSASAIVHTETSTPLATLAGGASSTVTFTGWTPPNQKETYTIRYITGMTETDQTPANDTMFARQVIVSDSVYARDKGAAAGSLGIGAGNGGYIGQNYEVSNTGTGASITWGVTRGYTNEKMSAVIWSMSAGKPSTIIASTDTIVYTDLNAGMYTLPIHGGPVTLTPGTYAVTVVEFDSTLTVANTTEIFTPRTQWVNWPTIPGGTWANVETFGVSFSKPFVIRPNFSPCVPLIDSVATTGAACGQSNGTATVATLGGGSFHYLWSNGDTTQTATGLAAGLHSVTVTDQAGCSSTLQFDIINLNGPVITQVSAVPPLCHVFMSTMTVTVNGGTLPYSYLWSTGDTTIQIMVTATGDYSVTVTDANGCSVTSAPTTVTFPDQLTSSITATDETCVSCNDGTATVTVNGGTAPYSYSWSPSGGSNASATGLAPGTYVVTVIDANGCPVSDTVTVEAFIAIGLNSHANSLFSIYPNPNKGSFQLKGSAKLNGQVKLEVMNTIGQVVFTQTLNLGNAGEAAVVNTQDLVPGTYTVKVTGKDQQISHHKMVIN